METESDQVDRRFAELDAQARELYMSHARLAARKTGGTVVKGDAAVTCDGRKYQVMPDGSWRRLK